MGRMDQVDNIIYNTYYDILENHYKKEFRSDFHIAGHKKEWQFGAYLKRFYHLANRGKRPYFRPVQPCIRLGLNVEKLYPKIDWRSRLTRGIKSDTEWAVGYVLYAVKKPYFYKNIPDKITIFEKYSEAIQAAESIFY